MSIEITHRYYHVDSYEDAADALASHDLSRDGALCSRAHTTVVWVGRIYDPAPTYDDAGEVTDPGTDRGLHINVSSRDPAIIDALDDDERLTAMAPDTPVSVLA